MWLKQDTTMRSHPFEVEFQLSEGQLHFAKTSQRFVAAFREVLIFFLQISQSPSFEKESTRD